MFSRVYGYFVEKVVQQFLFDNLNEMFGL